MEKSETLSCTEGDKGGHADDVQIEIFHGRRRFKDIDQGWAWVALLAGFISMMLTGACLTAVGIIHLYLLEAFMESDTKTAWVGAIFSGLQMLTGPLASAISSRWSCRTSMFIGGVLGPGSLAIGSQTNSLGMAFLTFGLLAGIGFGLVLTPTYAVMGYYFHRRLNVAVGIMGVGVSLGMTAAPACITFLETRYGWRGSLLVFSGMTLNICVAAALLKPSGLELQHSGRKPHSKEQPPRSNFCTECFCKTLPVFKKTCDVLTNKGLIFYVIALFLSNTSISILYLHLPKYCLIQGASLQDLHVIYLTMGCANVISKVLTGLGSGKVRSGESLDIFCLLLGAYSVAGTTLCVLPSVSHSQVGRVICFYLITFYYNMEPPLYLPISVDLVGLRNLNMALGVEMFGIGIGFIIGPLLAAWVRQVANDYKYSFYLGGAAFLLGALSCVMMMKTKRTRVPAEDSISTNTSDMCPKQSTTSM